MKKGYTTQEPQFVAGSQSGGCKQQQACLRQSHNQGIDLDYCDIRDDFVRLSKIIYHRHVFKRQAGGTVSSALLKHFKNTHPNHAGDHDVRPVVIGGNLEQSESSCPEALKVGVLI